MKVICQRKEITNAKLGRSYSLLLKTKPKALLGKESAVVEYTVSYMCPLSSSTFTHGTSLLYEVDRQTGVGASQTTVITSSGRS